MIKVTSGILLKFGKMEIIDTHAYYGKNNPLQSNYKLEDLIKARQKCQDHNLKFITISASPGTNINIADIVKSNSDFILGAYLQIAPRTDMQWRYTPPKEISVLAERKEIKGFKIITSLIKTPINSPLLEPYIEIAKSKDIPILFHCGASGTDYTSYEKNKALAEKHPNLKIILAHFGGLNPDFIKGSLALAREFPNTYLNTTGMSGEVKRYDADSDGKFYIKEKYIDIPLRKIWAQVLKDSMQDSVLASKILFGTDCPILAHQLYPIDQLPQKDQEKIMDNARKLFKL